MTALDLYLIGTPVVLVFSALLSMAGLGVAFLFVPFFYWLGVPLATASSTKLLLNCISLTFATGIYVRSRLVDFRAALPSAGTAVALSPLGAKTTRLVNEPCSGCLPPCLLFAGSLMLFYRSQRGAAGAAILGAGVGGVAGFLGGLLGVGGGNFIVPVLNWRGFDAKKAAGTTAFVVVFASLSGFLGHVSLGGLNYTFLAVMTVAAAAGAVLGSLLMRHHLSSPPAQAHHRPAALPGSDQDRVGARMRHIAARLRPASAGRARCLMPAGGPPFVDDRGRHCAAASFRTSTSASYHHRGYHVTGCADGDVGSSLYGVPVRRTEIGGCRAAISAGTPAESSRSARPDWGELKGTQGGRRFRAATLRAAAVVPRGADGGCGFRSAGDARKDHHNAHRYKLARSRAHRDSLVSDR
jgi:uncharacterized membrane protein YfcA